MLTRLTHVNLWVHDQDEALAFYTRNVRFEPRQDVTLAELGNYRYLTVAHHYSPISTSSSACLGRRSMTLTPRPR